MSLQNNTVQQNEFIELTSDSNEFNKENKTPSTKCSLQKNEKIKEIKKVIGKKARKISKKMKSSAKAESRITSILKEINLSLLKTKERKKITILSSLSVYTIKHYGFQISQILHFKQHSDWKIKEPLLRHPISKFVRTKMVDWMIEVFYTLGHLPQTFFSSVGILDHYLTYSKKIHSEREILLIGITSMFIASKIEEVVQFSIEDVVQRIGHNQVSKNEVLETELEICKALDFNISLYTSGHILKNYLAQLKYFFRKEISASDHELFKKLSKKAMFYCILATYEYSLLKFKPSTIVAGALYCGALTIGTELKHTQDIRLAQWIICLSGKNIQNFLLMEETARKLILIEQQFNIRFQGLCNVFKFPLSRKMKAQLNY